MVPTRSSRARTLRIYQRYCDPSIRLIAFCPNDLLWAKRRVIGLSAYKGRRKQRVFPLPDVVYNRCFNQKTETIARLEAAIGHNKCFNIINFFNKWYLYNILKPSGVSPYVPDTYLYDRDELPGLLKRYRLMYIKPVYGSMGKFVYRIEWMETGEIHVALHSLTAKFICNSPEDVQKLLDKHLDGRKYLVQQGIRSQLLGRRYFDFRVLMQKNRSGQWAITNIVTRFAYRQYFNTAVCEAVVDAAEILPLVFGPNEIGDIAQGLEVTSRGAALAAEEQLGLLGELSVDFIVDTENRLWIIELNGKPHKSIYEDLKGRAFQQHIFRRPMEYAAYLAETKAYPATPSDTRLVTRPDPKPAIRTDAPPSTNNPAPSKPE
nr:YheC/YheD family protein [Paenibacillus sacheonensis]